MSQRTKWVLAGLIAASAIVVAVCVFWHSGPAREQVIQAAPASLAAHSVPTNPESTATVQDAVAPRTNSSAAGTITAQRLGFHTRFEQKYKPAIQQWCRMYDGHLPITAESITEDKLVRSVGKDETYNEYIFSVNGVTVAVRDKKGVAQVSYLNNPEKTRLMGTIPDGTQQPILSSPTTEGNVMRMLALDMGSEFERRDVRIIPTGLSGAMNGGVNVVAGGDMNNFATWKVNVIFDTDGIMGYYLRGN